MQEEIGEAVTVGPLQWTAEVFFTDAGRRIHEIGLTFRWVPISQLGQLPGLVPPFLCEALKALPGGPSHIVDWR